MRIVAEAISLLLHPHKQLDKLAFITYLFATLHEWRVRLFGSTTTVKGATTAPLIPTLRPTGDSRLETLVKKVLHLQLITISLHAKESSHIEESSIPSHEIKHCKWRRGHNQSIMELTTVEILVWVRRHIAIMS